MPLTAKDLSDIRTLAEEINGIIRDADASVGAILSSTRSRFDSDAEIRVASGTDPEAARIIDFTDGPATEIVARRLAIQTIMDTQPEKYARRLASEELDGIEDSLISILHAEGARDLIGDQAVTLGRGEMLGRIEQHVGTIVRLAEELTLPDEKRTMLASDPILRFEEFPGSGDIVTGAVGLSEILDLLEATGEVEIIRWHPPPLLTMFPVSPTGGGARVRDILRRRLRAESPELAARLLGILGGKTGRNSKTVQELVSAIQADAGVTLSDTKRPRAIGAILTSLSASDPTVSVDRVLPELARLVRRDEIGQREVAEIFEGVFRALGRPDAIPRTLAQTGDVLAAGVAAGLGPMPNTQPPGTGLGAAANQALGPRRAETPREAGIKDNARARVGRAAMAQQGQSQVNGGMRQPRRSAERQLGATREQLEGAMGESRSGGIVETEIANVVGMSPRRPIRGLPVELQLGAVDRSYKVRVDGMERSLKERGLLTPDGEAILVTVRRINEARTFYFESAAQHRLSRMEDAGSRIATLTRELHRQVDALPEGRQKVRFRQEATAMTEELRVVSTIQEGLTREQRAARRELALRMANKDGILYRWYVVQGFWQRMKVAWRASVEAMRKNLFLTLFVLQQTSEYIIWGPGFLSDMMNRDMFGSAVANKQLDGLQWRFNDAQKNAGGAIREEDAELARLAIRDMEKIRDSFQAAVEYHSSWQFEPLAGLFLLPIGWVSAGFPALEEEALQTRKDQAEVMANSIGAMEGRLERLGAGIERRRPSEFFSIDGLLDGAEGGAGSAQSALAGTRFVKEAADLAKLTSDVEFALGEAVGPLGQARIEFNDAIERGLFTDRERAHLEGRLLRLEEQVGVADDPERPGTFRQRLADVQAAIGTPGEVGTRGTEQGRGAQTGAATERQRALLETLKAEGFVTQEEIEGVADVESASTLIGEGLRRRAQARR